MTLFYGTEICESLFLLIPFEKKKDKNRNRTHAFSLQVCEGDQSVT